MSNKRTHPEGVFDGPSQQTMKENSKKSRAMLLGCEETSWLDMYEYTMQCKKIDTDKSWHSVRCSNLGKYRPFKETFEEIIQLLLLHERVPMGIKCDERDGTMSFYLPSWGVLRMPSNALQPIAQYQPMVQLSASIPFDPELKIGNVICDKLSQRYNRRTNTLDLSNFHETYLPEKFVLPLSFILNTKTISSNKLFALRENMLHCENMNLSSNHIRFSKNILSHFVCNFKRLKNLDLSSNMLSDINQLCFINDQNKVHLEEVNLDNNPLCKSFTDSKSYVNAVLTLWPKIKILDGETVDPVLKMCLHKCFTVNEDSQNIVDHFLPTYFNIYDSDKREKLKEFYRSDSVMSVTCDFSVTGPSSHKALTQDLAKYRALNRNILKISNISIFRKNIFHGPDNIVEVLMTLPATEHDPSSFTVDVVYHKEDLGTILIVAGVYRHKDESLYRFSRTFTLKSMPYDKFCIMNEVTHVTFASENDFREYFQAPLRRRGEVNLINPSEDEQDKLTSIFCHLSNLLRLHARRRLVDSNWDIKEALNTFISDMTTDSISDGCFRTPKK